jgi:ATP-dependent Clp protease ATP-binding subunit ClpA
MEKIGFAKETDAQTAQIANYEETKSRVMTSLKDYFRPEFLNRVDDIIIFDILNKESIAKIVAIQVDAVIERLRTKDIHLIVVPEVLAYLAEQGYNPHYGARPLKRLIQNKILTPVAGLMISQGVIKGGTITVGLKPLAVVTDKNAVKNKSGDNAPTERDFTFDVKKKKKVDSAVSKESPIIIRTADLQS